jgi:hypothetical protein
MTRNCREARHRCRSLLAPVSRAERTNLENVWSLGTTRARTVANRDRVDRGDLAFGGPSAGRFGVDMA